MRTATETVATTSSTTTTTVMDESSRQPAADDDGQQGQSSTGDGDGTNTRTAGITVSLLDLAAASLAAAVVAAEVVVALASDADQKGGQGQQSCDNDCDGKNVRLKADGSCVTDADIASQHIIVDALRNVSEKIRLVGEESEEDMKDRTKMITGHEERVSAMFKLAQKEIYIRYNHNMSRRHHQCQQHQQVQPLPLSQRANEGATSQQNVDDTTHYINEDPPLTVDAAPTSIRLSPLTSSTSSSSSASHHHNRCHHDETKEDKLPLYSQMDADEIDVDPCRISVFIDPLDGTKAYAGGDYGPVSILIAIIVDEKPCFGVICKPFGYKGQTEVLDTGCVAIYGGTLLGGAFTAGGTNAILPTRHEQHQHQDQPFPPALLKTENDTAATTPCSSDGYSSDTLSTHDRDHSDALSSRRLDNLPRAVISSSKSKGVVEEFVAHLGERGMIHPTPLLITGAGEKSLRIVLRSENEGLWFYPKAGTSLWDVAASDALLRATGGRLTDKNGNDLDYSKSRTEAENENGVVACYDYCLHAECIKLFLEGPWNEPQHDDAL